MLESTMHKNTISIMPFLLGAAVGVAVGALFAHTGGTSVRRVLSYRVKNYIFMPIWCTERCSKRRH